MERSILIYIDMDLWNIMCVNWELRVTGNGSDDPWTKQGFSSFQGRRILTPRSQSAWALLQGLGLGSWLNTPGKHIWKMLAVSHRE